VCAGSIAMESTIENQSSEFADEGTAAHQIGALCLENNIDANTYIGQTLTVGKRSFKVDQSMADYVQIYVDQVRGYVEEYKVRGAVEVHLFVEVQVPIEHITGEEGGRGTSDYIIIAVWEDGSATLHVGDLKYGMGIEVEAVENPQEMIYGLGALFLYELLYDFKDVRLSIHQPRIKTAASEWECTIDHLITFGKHASERAYHALQVLNNEKPGAYVHHLVAGEHCKKAFCRARGNCPKLDKFVADAVGADFDEMAELDVKEVVEALPVVIEKDDATVLTIMDDGSRYLTKLEEGLSGKTGNIVLLDEETKPVSLSDKMAVLDIVDDWIKAVRGRVEYELLHGNEVPGYKLVEGRQGSRAWNDEDAAEQKLKGMRLKQEAMYSFKLLSPTQIEKLLKETPKRWNSMQEFISRSKGQPSVAPASDKRPALVIAPVANDFDAIDDGSDLL